MFFSLSLPTEIARFAFWSKQILFQKIFVVGMISERKSDFHDINYVFLTEMFKLNAKEDVHVGMGTAMINVQRE